MGFKGIYKQKSAASKIGMFFLLIFISVILHTILAGVLIALFSDNGMAILQTQDLTNQVSVNYLKLMQLFSGVGLFIVPPLLYSYLTGFDFKFTRITRQNTILVIAIMMLITPFVGLLLEWNMKIPFPEWFLLFDKNSKVIVEAFLKMSTIWDLLYTLIVIAVVPAIGEELLFRGYLQQNLDRWLNNSMLAIVITSFLFSAIHLDAQGVLPRFILGVLLGYLYYWGESLWMPILAHFVNNAQAVILSYPLFNVESAAYSAFPEAKTDPMMGLFSFFSVILLLYIFYQNVMIKKG